MSPTTQGLHVSHLMEGRPNIFAEMSYIVRLKYFKTRRLPVFGELP